MRKGTHLRRWSSAQRTGLPYGVPRFDFKRGPSARRALACSISCEDGIPALFSFHFHALFQMEILPVLVIEIFITVFHTQLLPLPYIGNEAKSQSPPRFCMQSTCRLQKQETHSHDKKCLYQIYVSDYLTPCLLKT